MFTQLFFLLQDFDCRAQDRIRSKRDRINAGFHQEGGKVRVVRGRLAADADLAAAPLYGGDDFSKRGFDRFVPLIVDVRNQRGVAVHAQGQLG